MSPIIKSVVENAATKRRNWFIREYIDQVKITILYSRGWHFNIFCTLIFVLGQDESQGSITEIADGQKSNLLLSGQGSTSYFSKTTIRIICST